MKGIGKVSRRKFLKGMFSAGALVLSVPVAPFKISAAAQQSSTETECLSWNRDRRERDPCGDAFGDGPGRSNLAANDHG